ncbi:MAG: TSUP family transporter [Clostridia bacterium]|nr:TSUP family transporter [Clostridia bacterium]
MFLYVLVGVLGGIAGGMGLGGGTILIPLLSIFLGVVQKQAQFFNVFSFVIMAIFVIFIHIKNKLISVFPAVVFAIFGCIFAILSAILVKDVSNSSLKVWFGIFLIVLAVVQLFVLLVKKNQKN